MLTDILITETTATAKLSGVLDTPAALACETSMQELLDHCDKHIIIDCSDLEYISSSGLRLFMALSKGAYAGGGDVTLTNLQPEVKEVFVMTGFDAFIAIQ